MSFSPLTISQLFSAETPTQWLSDELADAAALNLLTTSWMSGDPTLTCLQILASGQSQNDSLISGQAMGGFLDWAASGQITFTDVLGNVTTAPVSPDPSIPGQNPNAAVTWLDLLASSVYNVQRGQATIASITIAIINPTATNYGTFAAGTYHIANSVTGATFSNKSAFTLSASSSQNIVFVADQAGPYGNSAPGQITIVNTASPGVTVDNAAACSGNPFQSNTSLAAFCRAKLATLSPNGPSGAYQFFALVAALVLAGSPINGQGLVLASPLPSNVILDGGAVIQAVVSLAVGSGTVTTTVRNAGGAVGGGIGVAVAGATAASPIKITAPGHGLVTGDYAQVNLVQGLSGANGTFVVTVIDGSNFTLNGSSGSGSYTPSTGQVSGGDLYAIAAVINAYCRPNAVTAVVQSAAPIGVTAAATVYVPAQFVGDYAGKMTAAMTAFFGSAPIGGYPVDGAANVLPISHVEGVLYAAGQTNGQPYTISVFGLTLNGLPNDVVLGATGVAVLGSLAAINVVGI